MLSTPKILLFTIGLSTATLGYSQTNKIIYRDRIGDSTVLVNTAAGKDKKAKANLINKEIAGGLRLTTNGWGLNLDYGKYKRPETLDKKYYDNNYNTRFIRLNAGEMRNPKEYRSYNVMNNSQNAMSGFIFGKTHNHYHVDLVAGNRVQLGYKEFQQSVTIHWTYGLGYSAAILKPYTIHHTTAGVVQYNEDNKEYFLNAGYIESGSTIFDGWKNIELKHGAIVNTSFHFDFSNKLKQKLAVEVGANAYYYFNEFSTMLDQEPKKFVPDAYANFIIGIRKAKNIKKKSTNSRSK